ncbi:MAG TPA: ABC transporter substrate-binding protein [Candidatus Acidoferrum sp.]|nr:ABC transporter substrate-binding protein [Candidatus Acidoferrum sp.]
MGRLIRSLGAGVLLFSAWNPLVASPAVAAPEGQMILAQTISIAPRWFDPADAEGIITPFIFYYAMHDALVKPMPGNPLTPCLAESWTVSADGLTYEFVLRRGVRFHNGDPVTAEDVKFSFERYRGAAARMFKDRVSAVEIVDPQRVRFRLSRPWPDFMAFYGTPTTGAGWIVPKRYVEKVGEDGFKKAPVGAGPYKFSAFKPGVELVLEANEQYWRKVPHIKTVIIRSVPDETTRLAMLKRGEADVSYLFRGALAEEVRRSQGLTLKPYYLPLPFWLMFAEQWDSKSPWADRRVRLAANLAIDRNAINQAETLGLSKLTASIIPQRFEFYWPAPLYAHDPAKARQLLAEAGYPNGFDAGSMAADLTFVSLAEAIANDLGAVGIRATLRPLERAALFKEYQDKRLKHLFLASSAAFGNAASRLDAFVASGGLFTYGTYADIEGLVREQATELDRGKREAILHRIQQLMHDKAMFAPIFELASLGAYGPRVAESGLGLIPSMAASAPYEDLKLKGK